MNSVIRRSFVRIESGEPGRVSYVGLGRIVRCITRVETGSHLGYHWSQLVAPTSTRLWISGLYRSRAASAVQSSPISAYAADWADTDWSLTRFRPAAPRARRPRRPNKIIKIFLLEGFFYLPPVSLTPVANLELPISPRIFEKIQNGSNGILGGLGDTDSWKKPEVENLVSDSL